MFPVYLRREPSQEPHAPRYGARKAFDVVAYGTRDAAVPVARWPWHVSRKPRKGAKQARTVMLNCFRYAVTWLDDVVDEGNAA